LRGDPSECPCARPLRSGHVHDQCRARITRDRALHVGGGRRRF
jgi:hypothetical protein